MTQSTPQGSTLHVAIIMDGNGRWAGARGLARAAGHRAGADAVRRAIEAAPALGIRVLTLYAFSSDNWGRPPAEVGALMDLFADYLIAETARCVQNGVRLRVIGRRDRLPETLAAAIDMAECATAAGRRLDLRIAVDYSSRHAMREAVRRARPDTDLFAGWTDVDLLIRTGGEQRLSDFLLWESAYAELYFTKTMWPDFSAADLTAAVEEFTRRDRRFGRLAS